MTLSRFTRLCLIGSLPLVAFGASAQTAPRNAPALASSNNAMLRIVCDGSSNNAEVTINGVFKGECSVDVPVAEGSIRLRVVKQVDATRERVFEQEIRMAAGTVKRVEVELGSPQMTAKARREEDERIRQQQALAAQRAAEERRIALEKEQKEAAVKAAAAQAAALVQQKAEAGDLPSMLELAEKYYKVKEADSLKQAGVWFKKALDAGSPQGFGGFAGVLYSTKNPERDEAQAVQLYRRGAEAGDPRSLTSMSFLYATGKSGVARDFKLAQEMIFKAVEKNFAPAIGNLAAYYATGNYGLKRDDAEALKWYQKGAESGDPRSMVGIGFAFEKGSGVPQDDRKAMEWYRKASDLGEARAMTNLGVLLEQGRGGASVNHAEATALYQKAADLDDELGQFNLANQYTKGNGVRLDESEALKWYEKAAAQGHENARLNAAELKAKGVR